MEDLGHIGEELRQISGKIKEGADWDEVRKLLVDFRKTELIETFPGNEDTWLKSLFVVNTTVAQATYLLEKLRSSHGVEYAEVVAPRHLTVNNRIIGR